MGRATLRMRTDRLRTDMDLLKQLTVWLASGAAGAAAVLIGLAAVEATWRSLLLFVPGRAVHAAGRPQDAKEAVRLRLGRWLAVALEFEKRAMTWEETHLRGSAETQGRPRVPSPR